MYDHAQSPRLGQPVAPENTTVRMFTGTEIPEVSVPGQIIFRSDTQVLQVYDNDAGAWVDSVGGDLGILTFVQSEPPVGVPTRPLHQGDLWFDSDDGNRPYQWDGTTWIDIQDAAIAAAQAKADLAYSNASDALSSANDAQATADGKVDIFYQADQPTSTSYGDLWIDTDDNKLYRYNGSTWDLVQDADIAQALLDAANAQSTADGKITAYYQTDPPTTPDIGDLWYDTDDNNKPYYWNGTTWVTIRDGSIAAASQSASDAMTQANNAMDAATQAQATADGSITTYYQASAPTGLNNTSNVGDLWFDTDDNQVYRWNGTAWVSVQDQAIITALTNAQNAQTTADGKITAFYQTTAPTTGMDVGDLWYDTDDNNKPYYYNGTTWITLRDGTIQTAITTANNAQTSANGKNQVIYSTSAASGTTNPSTGLAYINGDVWFRFDGSNNVIGQWAFNGTSWVSKALSYQVIASIDAASITVGLLQGTQISGTAIDGKTITGAILQTSSSTSAARVVLDSSGLRGYPSGSGASPNTTISTSDGSLTATNVTISGNLRTGTTSTYPRCELLDSVGQFWSYAQLQLFSSSSTVGRLRMEGNDLSMISTSSITMDPATTFKVLATDVTLTSTSSGYGGITLNGGVNNNGYDLQWVGFLGTSQIKIGGGNGASGRLISGIDYGSRSGASTTTNSSGQVAISHSLPSAPTTVLISSTESGVNTSRRTYQVVAKGTSTFTVEARDSAGALLASGSACNFDWVAIA